MILYSSISITTQTNAKSKTCTVFTNGASTIFTKHYSIMTYYERKEAARQEAIDWQLNDADYPYSYEGLAIIGNYFYKLARRFGLIREFRENGIPC